MNQYEKIQDKKKSLENYFSKQIDIVEESFNSNDFKLKYVEDLITEYKSKKYEIGKYLVGPSFDIVRKQLVGICPKSEFLDVYEFLKDVESRLNLDKNIYKKLNELKANYTAAIKKEETYEEDFKKAIIERLKLSIYFLNDSSYSKFNLDELKEIVENVNAKENFSESGAKPKVTFLNNSLYFKFV